MNKVLLPSLKTCAGSDNLFDEDFEIFGSSERSTELGFGVFIFVVDVCEPEVTLPCKLL